MKTKLFSLLVALFATTALFGYEYKGISYSTRGGYGGEETVSVSGPTDAYRCPAVINIPSTVTFDGITYRVTSIDDKAFFCYTGLTSITIPNSVTSIGEAAFYGTGLTSITIPDSVINIRKSTFAGCDKLVSATMGHNVESIGERAFCGTGLTSITIPNSVTSIGEAAFADCKNLTSITIPNSVTSIEDDTFYRCEGLTSVTIGCNVVSIGESAFSCTGLTSITIPNSVTSIGEAAFKGCSALIALVVESENTIYDSRNNCNALIETSTNTLMQGCNTTIIPYGVTRIKKSAFSHCRGLASIIIPNSVTSIGESAFYGCGGLTSATIGCNVESIGESAFSYTGLTSITIPNSVTSIGRSAFYGCTELISITVEKGNIMYDSRDDCNALIETATNTLTLGCGTTIIPNSVTSIGYCAFFGCTGLTSITIPNSVTSIGGCAFYGCTGLTSITIPNGVTSIGGSAFYGCTSLTAVTFGDNVTSIGDWAFFGCEGLSSVIIGSSVTHIGESAWGGCHRISVITWNATNYVKNPFDHSQPLDILVFGSGVKAISGDMIGNNVNTIVLKTKVPPIVEGKFRDIIQGTIYTPCGTKHTYISDKRWCYFGSSTYNEIPDSAFLTVLTRNTIAGQVSIIKYNTCDNNEAQISATPNAHYYFMQWSDGNTDNPRSVFVTSDTCFIAEFDSVPQYTITILCDSERGYTSGSGIYDADEKITISATAFDGFLFAQWSDGNTDTPRTIVVTSDTTFTAEFMPVSAVNNVTSNEDVNTKKLFHNGKLFIIRGRRMYDALGNEVTIKD